MLTARTILRAPGGVTVDRLIGVSGTTGYSDLWLRDQARAISVLCAKLKSTFANALGPSRPVGPSHWKVITTIASKTKISKYTSIKINGNIAHTERSFGFGSFIFRRGRVNWYKVHVVCVTLMRSALPSSWKPKERVDHAIWTLVNSAFFK